MGDLKFVDLPGEGYLSLKGGRVWIVRPGQTVELTPARRAVLLGLYEGRRLYFYVYSAWWAEVEGTNSKQHPKPVRWLMDASLIERGDGNAVVLTPAGRTLAERLAREGK